MAWFTRARVGEGLASVGRQQGPDFVLRFKCPLCGFPIHTPMPRLCQNSAGCVGDDAIIIGAIWIRLRLHILRVCGAVGEGV